MTRKLEDIFSFLDKEYPNAKCALNYTKDYEFLIAVMLSAQTTDNAVNKATAVLFKKYPTIESLANADLKDVTRIISFLGMYQKKAENVISISKLLIRDFDGKVPNNPAYLVTLPGVGNKTKNCVLGELYNVPLLAVDTHVQRISKRLKLVDENDSVETIERKLTKLIPQQRLIKTNHQIIWFGRSRCKAMHPLCKDCPLAEYCKY